MGKPRVFYKPEEVLIVEDGRVRKGWYTQECVPDGDGFAYDGKCTPIFDSVDDLVGWLADNADSMPTAEVA